MTKDSALNRALRVFVYLALTAFVAVLGDASAVKYVQDTYPVTLPLFVFLPPLMAFLRGYLDKSVKNF